MMSRASSGIFLVLALVAASSAWPSEGSRVKRFMFSFPWSQGQGQGYDCSAACPLHSCKIDPAVIHGFCCGCAKWLDRVPIQCPHNLQCPWQGAQLCRDYNFMMDCCC